MAPTASTMWDTISSEYDHTLAGEHALLLRDVRRRAAAVLALVEAHTWPGDELGTLIAFLRAEVFRQASDEETLLYPGDATTGPFAELSADHALLYTLNARLEEIRAQPCPLPELRATVEELLATLRRHLLDEQAVLATLAGANTPVPAASEVVSGERHWSAGGTSPVRIRLDSLPPEHAAQLCIERLLRLRPGQDAEVSTPDDEQAQQVCRWLHGFDSARFGLSHSRSGDGHSLLYVSRRMD